MTSAIFDLSPPTKPHAEYNERFTSCSCCPYGYHIDLDFVRYCDSLDQNRQHARDRGTLSKRRERRLQRQSMEVMLGLIAPNQNSTSAIQNEQSYNTDSLRRETLGQIGNRIAANWLVEEALQTVVSDFEKTLTQAEPSETKNTSSNNFSSTSSISSLSSESGDGRCKNVAPVAEKPVANTNALQNIREQMAASLARMKDLEEQVSSIPFLQAQLVALKDENRKLLFQVSDRSNKENQWSRGNSLPRLKNHSLELNKTRDASVMCSVITRDIGVNSTQLKSNRTSPITVDSGTQMTNGLESITEPQDLIINEQEINKQSDCSTQTNVNSSNCSIQTNVNLSDIVISKPKHSVSVGLQTLDQRWTRVTSTTQTIDFTPKKRDVAVSFKPTLLNCSSLTDPELIKCKKCEISKDSYDATTQTVDMSSKSESDLTMISLSKGLNMMVDYTDKRTRTVGVQYIALQNCTKSVQAVPIISSKPTQYEALPGSTQHKFCQSEKCTYDVKCTETNDLTKFVNKSCNTVHKTFVDIAVDADIKCSCKTKTFSDVGVEVDIKCRKCKIKSKENGTPEKKVSVSQSKIPRPSVVTPPVPDNRKFVRQDTYTKIQSPSNEDIVDKLTALECLTSVGEAASVDCEHTNETRVHQKIEASTSVHLTQNEHRVLQTSSNQTNVDLSLAMLDKPREKVGPSKEMRAAMKVLNDYLQKPNNSNNEHHMKNANKIVQHEWFKISSTAHANPLDVEDYLDCFEDVSSKLMQYIVNMADNSGNTAMHYAVSHGNFDVVSILLDSKVCDINRPNIAGYTSVMLVSLAEVRSSAHVNVVRRLFQLADVNIRAKQHGQTALMLAVSHGRLDMATLLLEAGADINIQDEDGSTALMCAAEHGHVDIVRLFLSQHDCDSCITDVDGSSALKIALDAGHRDIGVLLYAHERMSKGASPYASLRRPRTSSRSKTASVTSSPSNGENR